MIYIISLGLYLAISFYITIYVGYHCYKVGEVFLKNYVADIRICKSINQLLLMGYYLLNLGYVAKSLLPWGNVNNLPELISVVAIKISTIVIILCVLHYLNMLAIYTFGNKQIINP